MTTSLPDDYRAKAVEQRALANQLLEKPDLMQSPKLLVAAIAGQVNATVYDGLADMMDYLSASGQQDGRMNRLRVIMTRNDAIRKAAAKGQASGDWSLFDKLVAEEQSSNGSG